MAKELQGEEAIPEEEAEEVEEEGDKQEYLKTTVNENLSGKVERFFLWFSIYFLSFQLNKIN